MPPSSFLSAVADAANDPAIIASTHTLTRPDLLPAPCDSPRLARTRPSSIAFYGIPVAASGALHNHAYRLSATNDSGICAPPTPGAGQQVASVGCWYLPRNLPHHRCLLRPRRGPCLSRACSMCVLG